MDAWIQRYLVSLFQRGLLPRSCSNILPILLTIVLITFLFYFHIGTLNIFIAWKHRYFFTKPLVFSTKISLFLCNRDRWFWIQYQLRLPGELSFKDIRISSNKSGIQCISIRRITAMVLARLHKHLKKYQWAEQLLKWAVALIKNNGTNSRVHNKIS